MDRAAVRDLTRIVAGPTALAAGGARAHDAGAVAAAAWHPDPFVVLLLVVAAGVYAAGAWQLWRRAGVGRGITLAQAGWFAGGWFALAIALVSPLDAWGSRRLWLHMLQHELLMVVAAPLLVLGRPLEAWTWALPIIWRRRGGTLARNRRWRAVWLALTLPLGAWLVHGAAIWIWHARVLFQAALASEAIHTLQHTSFLAAALAFWWAAFDEAAHRPRLGISAVMLFSTMLHTGALGALMTFSSGLWYPAYAGRASVGGLAPIEDQQLAGLIMWVPAGTVYMAAALALAARALMPARKPVA